MFNVAFYGKGGIGKSTVSSNVSYILSEKGKVLHIGCDPKHDSTRLLLPTGKQPTVLEKINGGQTPKDLSEIVVEGKRGVLCVESGGPEPGVGCAGRGIITTFGILETLGIEDLDPDFKVFDVLGDVVCGGFAIPMRSDRSDGIILVTSGEFMSIFAANNILKGIVRLDKDSPRIIGIVLNSRGVENERELVTNFAECVDLPILAVIPRTGMIRSCEESNEPLEALFPGSEPANEIRKIADAIVNAAEGAALHTANPLDDEQMECILHGRCPQKKVRTSEEKTKIVLRKKDIIDTCSAAGAVDIGYFVKDMDILLHSPDSCAYIFSSFHDRMNSNQARLRNVDFDPSGNRMYCTGLTDAHSIFGGSELLREKLESMICNGSRNIMVITTCMAGIIGDDVGKVVKEVEREHAGTCITFVKCDGNMTGHMGEGLYLATKAMFRYIDQTVEPDPEYVNILAMSFMKLSYVEKYASLLDLFALFGLKVHCRFIGECTIDEIRNLKKGSLNVVVSDIVMACEMAEELREYSGIDYLVAPAPIGFSKTCEWLEKLGEKIGKPDTAREAVSKFTKEYRELIDAYSPRVKDRRIAIYCDSPKNIAWAVEVLSDLGADIVYAGFGRQSSKRIRMPEIGRSDVEVREEYTVADVMRDFAKDRPDLLISRDESLRSLDCHHMEITDGYTAMKGLRDFVNCVVDSLSLKKREGWRD